MTITKQSVKNFLRWASVLPAFIIGLVLGSILANLFFMFSSWFIGMNPDSGYNKIMEYIVAAAIGGASSIYLGIKVAPSHRKIIAIILFSFIVILAALSFLFTLFNWQAGFMWYLLSSIATAVGAGCVLYQYFEDGDDILNF